MSRLGWFGRKSSPEPQTNPLSPKARKRARRAAPAVRRSAIEYRPLVHETLEVRSMLATFSEAGVNLNLDLTASESVGIVSAGSSYTLSLTGGNWTGSNSANVSGNG